MNHRILQIAWISTFVLAGACHSISNPKEEDLTITGLENNVMFETGPYIMTFFVTHLKPSVYSEVGCGGDPFRFEYEYELSFRNNRNPAGRWYELEDVKIDITNQTAAGTIPPKSRSLLVATEDYDARIVSASGAESVYLKAFTVTINTGEGILKKSIESTSSVDSDEGSVSKAAGIVDSTASGPSSVLEKENPGASNSRNTNWFRASGNEIKIDTTLFDTHRSTCTGTGACTGDCPDCASIRPNRN